MSALNCSPENTWREGLLPHSSLFISFALYLGLAHTHECGLSVASSCGACVSRAISVPT